MKIQCGKRFIMSVGRAALAQLLSKRMAELNLSAPEVARRSSGAISHGTVWNIINSRVRDVKEDTLKGLAKALELPEEEVFDAYRGKPQEELSSSAQRVISFYNEMSPTAQRHFELIGETLWRESKRAAQDVGGSGDGRKNRLIPPGGRRMPVITKGAGASAEQEKKRA